MDDIEAYMRKLEQVDDWKRWKFHKLVGDTVGHDGELLMELLTMKVAKRFGVRDDYEYSPCYRIVHHYMVSDIDMRFKDWLYCDDAPFLKPLSSIGRIFPEFKEFARDDRHIVDLANRIYGLDLKVDIDWYTHYVYSYSLNFNDFIPIDYGKVKELKAEIDFCRKYGLDYSELEQELVDMGLCLEELEED